MYENYTRQSLPAKEYRELLGTAICVFNSNNSFIIENVLREDGGRNYSWYDLIDKTSGQLKAAINDTITTKAGSEIAQIFSDLVDKRNRIIHSFQITNDDKEQILATKDKQHNQFVIIKEYLLDFIKGNEVLSDKLYTFRGY